MDLPDVKLPEVVETPPLPDRVMEPTGPALAPPPEVQIDRPKVEPLPVSPLPDLPRVQYDVAGSLPAMPELPELPSTSFAGKVYDQEQAEMPKALAEMPSLPDLPAGDFPPHRMPQLQPLDEVQMPLVQHEAPGDVQAIQQEFLQQKYAQDDLPQQLAAPESPELHASATQALPDLPNADLPSGTAPEAPHIASGGDSLSALSGLLSTISAGIKKLVEAAEAPQTSTPATSIRYSSRYDE